MGKVKKFIKTSKLVKKLLSVILILVLIIIIIIIATYVTVIDTGTYKENNWSNAPYASSEYIAGTKIGSNGAIETTETAQEIWDKLIKNGSNIEQYLDGPEELKKLMNAEIATQLLNTSNSDEEIDWDKINSDASSKEVQGLVKLLRAKTDGTISEMEYVSPSDMDFFIANGYTEKVLNSFTIGEKSKKKYSSSVRADFSVEAFIEAVQNVCDEVTNNVGEWCYGCSGTTKPCDPEVVNGLNAAGESDAYIGQTRRLIACDRLISLALWNMGLTDQPAGGICGAETMQTYLQEHGFMQITDRNDLQAGDIVITGIEGGEEVHHWFVLADYSPDNGGHGRRYDMGNNGRIINSTPYPREDEPLLYGGKTFYCAYRVNGSGFVGKTADISLGDRYDITETTTDIHGNNLLDRISDTENGSLHGKTLEELSRDGINLSYLVIPYYGIDGRYHSDGEMIVNTKAADEVLLIFQELYKEQYPIERLQLVDDFNASDKESVIKNNTSAFNYRTASDDPTALSNHARGFAIDVNPLVNPYIYNYWGGGTKRTDYNTDSKFMDRDNMSRMDTN